MKRAALAQGIYYVITGLWPIIHMRSFGAVTGRKRDSWLAQANGALIAAVGVALLVGARAKGKPLPAHKALGVASAAALGGSDAIFVAKGRIPRIYAVDAVAEAALIGLWIADG
jgi:hypothetical protein